MNLKLIKTAQCGLEVYKVYVNGTLVNYYMSRAAAVSRFIELKQQFKL